MFLKAEYAKVSSKTNASALSPHRRYNCSINQLFNTTPPYIMCWPPKGGSGLEAYTEEYITDPQAEVFLSPSMEAHARHIKSLTSEEPS